MIFAFIILSKYSESRTQNQVYLNYVKAHPIFCKYMKSKGYKKSL